MDHLLNKILITSLLFTFTELSKSFKEIFIQLSYRPYLPAIKNELHHSCFPII